VKRLPAPAEPIVPKGIIIPQRIVESLADTGYENLGKRYYRPSASFWEAARIAVDSLNKSKLRSFLTFARHYFVYHYVWLAELA
jgi:hypothetical protein